MYVINTKPTGRIRCGLLCLSLLSSPISLGASHYAEQQFAKQLGEVVSVGQKQTLDTGTYSFLALYTEAYQANSRGAVILLHDLGGHPDWPQIIGPLRTELPNRGWNTLSLQLDTRDSEADRDDYEAFYLDTGKRLQTAIKFVEGKGIYNIVLIGHGLGAGMALHHLSAMGTEANKSIIAFVGIAMSDPSGIGQSFKSPATIQKPGIPVLDIYGSLDSPEVLDAALQRHIAVRRAGKKFLSQVKIAGADHYLSGLGPLLTKRITTWINKQAPSVEIERNLSTAPKNP